MKSILFQIIFSAIFLVAATPLKAQFEGVIKYSISFENLPPEMEDYKSQLPSQATSTIKGSMVKMEQPLGMGMKQVIIMDNEAESGVMLMDVMGQKKAIVLDKENREKFEQSQPQPEFKYLDETKEIAGYECKKAVMTMSDGKQDVELELFYTEEIESPGINEMRGLKGFPLQYSTSSGPFVMTFTAESVEEKKVSEEEFTIPEGYEHITLDQFQQSMGR